MEKVHLSLPQFSMIAMAGMLCSMILSIPAGGIADKIGIRKMIGIAYVLAIIAGLSRIFATSFLPFFIASMFCGVAAAMQTAVLGKLFGNWFGAKAGRAAGIMGAVAMLGQSLSTGTGALWPSLDAAYIGAAVFVAISGIFFVIVMKDKPFEMAEEENTLPSHKVPLKKAYILSLKSKNVWFSGLFLCLFMGGSMCIRSFLPAALQTGYGIDTVTAGSITAIASIGFLFGNLLTPNFCIKLASNRIVTIIAGIGSAVFTFLSWQFGGSAMIWPVVFLAGFFWCSIQPIYLSAVTLMDDIPDHAKGSAGGIVTTLMMLGAFCIPSFIITPIAGTNYQLLFLMASACGILIAVLGFIAPDLMAIKAKENAESIHGTAIKA
jgi:NNP family nitrate/nitrite transporter-like MFS transporter